ncbi:hypothetical protein KAT80_00915 [Candidatus Pacearchaeota archaeon]|nr:hypothetical protein [Candidatus Pacearchaeota archaeon]
MGGKRKDNSVINKPKKTKSQQGKLNRAAGARFELKVRGKLEEDGWIIDKWTKNVDLKERKLIPAKPKFVFNPQLKRRIPIGMSSGFPDFIAFKKIGKESYDVIGVEVKGDGWLDKSEKEKCAWYLQNKVFSQIWIAKKAEKRGQVEYIDFVEKYGDKHNKT